MSKTQKDAWNKPETNALCPVCHSEGEVFLTEIRDYFVKNGNSIDFMVSYCKACAMGFSLPALTENELSDYYPDGYEPHLKKQGLKALLQSLKYKMDVRLIRSLCPPHNTSVFEIGPGNAELLFHLKQNGYDVAGIEPGKSGRDCALRNWGIKLQEGYARDIKFEKKYDIVIARYVLEHVNQPRELLETTYQNGLKPGGKLLIKIPNMSSWEADFFSRYWSGWDAPRHRVHFTPEGIKALLTNIGFTDIKISFEVVPVDLPVNFEYWARYSETKNTLINRMTLLTLKITPQPILFACAQILGWALKPWGPGRMTVTAKKP